MDYFNNTEFYTRYGTNTKSKEGLKFYSGMDRDSVFKKQENFCKQKGIFITDIVKEIKPKRFYGINDNFRDTEVDKAVLYWNTLEIIELINNCSLEKILLTFGNENNTIKNISLEIEKIEDKLSKGLVISHLKSPSGAAGLSYDKIVEDWRLHLSEIQ
ncbi:MAG: hypothetical protein KF721_15790 [Ignavibacteriaceae bacterium]|nr:hypothetical protein [Ignavibacteriaceae bacterium]